MAKWIEFVEREQSARTRNWWVRTKGGDATLLGDVKWFGKWRCYAFFPRPETVFERICLRDIALFCEQQTKAHKEAPHD